jgi:hypothetical protein
MVRIKDKIMAAESDWQRFLANRAQDDDDDDDDDDGSHGHGSSAEDGLGDDLAQVVEDDDDDDDDDGHEHGGSGFDGERDGAAGLGRGSQGQCVFDARS